MIYFPDMKEDRNLYVCTRILNVSMLGSPKYNGKFEFGRKKLHIPDVFARSKTTVCLKRSKREIFLEMIDRDTLIYSANGQVFKIIGKEEFVFSVNKICRKLVVGHGKAFILTSDHVYVYNCMNIEILKINALDLVTSPFNEIFVLTESKILVFDDNGVKEEYEYSGNAMHIHFYLFRELIVVSNNSVFHLNLNTGCVNVLYCSRSLIKNSILRDRLYIREATKVTSLNLEERTSESIYTGKPLKLCVGDTMVALYNTNGDFIFCDRFDLINSQGMMYDIDVHEFLGFFFCEDKFCFLFNSRIFKWSVDGMSVTELVNEKVEDYKVEFPDNIEELKRWHKFNRKVKVKFEPGKVNKKFHEMLRSVFRKDDEATAKKESKKKIKYADRRSGGF
ncbi:hypothetical protein HK407_05g10490 [Ordospora pajunii]|uniref:uncharacterized protein n=1 Tax=Ordospora pajunii TaxID=3039483 RepID=UPI0029527DDD|nr:uncharacterized protein HK407_05g10490 [Ordospora pajunii]KAH9411381.1 hypothetical protein HK407_05g10490 [Ordospora pajunii]